MGSPRVQVREMLPLLLLPGGGRCSGRSCRGAADWLRHGRKDPEAVQPAQPPKIRGVATLISGSGFSMKLEKNNSGWGVCSVQSPSL